MLNDITQYKARLINGAGKPRENCLTASLSVAAVLCGATFLFFLHLGRYGLWEPDEARYAEISREMLNSGNYIVPHLNYVPYIEKPPLLYWLNALAMRVFGVNEFAARLVNVLSALFVIGIVLYFTQKAFDRRRGLLAVVVLATSVLYAVMAQVLTTDMLLTAAITSALFSGFLQWRDGGQWRWLFYAAMGCGILAKGPAGGVVPLLVMVLFCAWEGTLQSTISRFKPFSGLCLTAGIAAPWFIAVMLQEHDFFDFYFVGEHLRRFFQSSYSHSEPIYYYVPVIAAGLLPWALLVPFLPWRRLALYPARRFCLIAAGTIFILFSLANAKLIPYVLPVLPPLAIVIADGLAAALGWAGPSMQWPLDRAGSRLLTFPALALALAGAALLLVAAHAAHFHSPNPMLVRPALYLGGMILLAGGIISASGFWLGWGRFGLSAFGLSAAALIVVLSYGRLMAEPARSYAAFARVIEQRAPGATLVCYPRYVQSLPFYCRRRVILVGPETELAYGAAHSPDASKFFFTSRQDLLRLWDQLPSVVVVVDRSVFPSIKPKLGQFTTIASNAKKLALGHLPIVEKPQTPPKYLPSPQT